MVHVGGLVNEELEVKIGVIVGVNVGVGVTLFFGLAELSEEKKRIRKVLSNTRKIILGSSRIKDSHNITHVLMCQISHIS